MCFFSNWVEKQICPKPELRPAKLYLQSSCLCVGNPHVEFCKIIISILLSGPILAQSRLEVAPPPPPRTHTHTRLRVSRGWNNCVRRRTGVQSVLIESNADMSSHFSTLTHSRALTSVEWALAQQLLHPSTRSAMLGKHCAASTFTSAHER